MIKYIGSKRRLVPAITRTCRLLTGGRPGVALDLFSGTSRVGHALKREGWRVLASDTNAYAHALAACYVQADRERVLADATRLLDELRALPPRPGYFTQTFCERSRFIHPDNGARVDAIRERIAQLSLDPLLEKVLLVSLMEGADRVDSTTGVQMAYLKSWAPRAHRRLELRLPDVLPRASRGPGLAFQGDALDAAEWFGAFAPDAGVAYLDPPYNQHSYLGNYHVWETLVRWDKPEVYGVACKRVDCKTRKSRFNSRPRIAEAVRELIEAVRARNVILSFSDEGMVSREQIESMLAERFGESPVVLEPEDHRYVGAKIGIHNPAGERVGTVGRLRNREYLFVAGKDAARLRERSVAA
ncbi:MAG: DNA adenine methylase [Phycisphaerales bacterium JB059]